MKRFLYITKSIDSNKKDRKCVREEEVFDAETVLVVLRKIIIMKIIHVIGKTVDKKKECNSERKTFGTSQIGPYEIWQFFIVKQLQNEF